MREKMPFTDDDREKLTEMHTLVRQKLIPMMRDHEKRIRSLEKGRLKEIGATGAITGALGYFAHIIFK